jgi:acylphosphatase
MNENAPQPVIVKRLEAKVAGRVQGVSFRAYAMREAQSLNLVGWVQNSSDGSVHTVAEGTERDLLLYIDFLHVGSPMSRVDNVSIVWNEATGEFAQFILKGMW